MKVFPYARLRGAVSLRVDAAKVKAPEQPREQLDSRARSVVERVVALGGAETQDWETATLTVSATIPSKATEPGGPWSDVLVVAVLTDRTTNTRVTSRLAPETEGGREWRGDLQVLRSDIFDRANLTAQAVTTIQQAAAAAKSGNRTRIGVTGHADRSGTDAYNMALSLRRANAVKDQLVREGIPAAGITVVGRGESQPLVPTADGVREPQNRRVEIVLQ